MKEDGGVISIVKNQAVNSLSWQGARSTNLHIEKRMLKRGHKLLARRQPIPIERDTIMVFADQAPRFNWAHPCRYLLHDAKNGELYREVPAQFPPYMTGAPKTYEVFHEPIPLPDRHHLWPILPKLRCPIRWKRGQRYAVLFSGASNNRHTNDLEFLYRTLRDLYGFPAANIRVLNYDGTVSYSGGPQPVTSWPGDSTAYRMPVDGQGTKADLDGVLDELKKKLKREDVLLIHTNNHGGHNGTESYLCTYSGADYLASDFALKLGTLPAHHCLMVMMEQCHAGGFNAPILSNSTASQTSVSSACLELNNSIGGADFDPFARDWISAMAGATPSGGALASNPDSDGSGKVSAEEAHNYADAVKDPYDTPVFSASSTEARACHLGQRYFWFWPVYCRILVDLLRPHYQRRPISEFYDIVHQRLVPQLTDIEQGLTLLSETGRSELPEQVATRVARAFGGSPRSQRRRR